MPEGSPGTILPGMRLCVQLSIWIRSPTCLMSQIRLQRYQLGDPIADLRLSRRRSCFEPISGYTGFDPASAPNNGEGFDKNLSGNELPNAPPFTVSFGAQYTVPITPDWAGTLRGDYYWQDYSWARVFNDNPYDRLRGYTNVNLTLILTNQNGWQVMLLRQEHFQHDSDHRRFPEQRRFGPDDQRLPDRSQADRHPRHEKLVGGTL